MKPSSLPTFRTLHASHAVLTAIVIAGISYQIYLTARLAGVHEPAQRAITAITLQITEIHLAYDAARAADRNGEKSIQDHIEIAEGYARALLRGGEYRGLRVARLDDPPARERLLEIASQLAGLRLFLGEHPTSEAENLGAAVGTGGDGTSPKIFYGMLANVRDMSGRLRHITNRERRALLRTQICFLLGWILAAAAGVYVLRLLKRRNREAFAAIERAKAEMRRLVQGVESTVEAVIMTNVKGEIFYVNPAFTTLTGYEPQEVIGKNPRVLKSGLHSEDLYKKLWQTILSGRVWMGEITNRRKDGSLYEAAVTIAPVMDEHGAREGFVAVQANITERKQTEDALRHLTEVLQDRADELRHSNEELAQFAYVASHDLQEPLRMVASFTQLLEQRYGDRLDEDGREFIAYAVDGTHRMQALIHALLEYSRVGSREVSRGGVDLQQVLDGVLANLRTTIDEHGATITHTPLPAVEGDAIQLGQLLQNLVGNAIKFHSERPIEIHVSAERHDGEWRFAVSDNGIGIDPQYAERVFVIFQRLHTRDRYQGTGIGLAVCKKIVHAHGGRIWVESQPEQGATFYFTLPAMRPDFLDRERATLVQEPTAETGPPVATSATAVEGGKLA